NLFPDIINESFNPSCPWCNKQNTQSLISGIPVVLPYSQEQVQTFGLNDEKSIQLFNITGAVCGGCCVSQGGKSTCIRLCSHYDPWGPNFTPNEWKCYQQPGFIKYLGDGTTCEGENACGNGSCCQSSGVEGVCNDFTNKFDCEK